MIKRFTFLAILVAVGFGLQAQKQSVTLEDIWMKGTYYGEGVRGFQAMNDGETYVQLDIDREREIQELNKYSIKEGSRLETIVSNANFGDLKINLNVFRFSKDEQKIMFLTDIKRIYRHSFESRFYVYDRKTEKLQGFNKSVRYPQFNADASKVAYVFENNLYIMDLESLKETQVTTDGKFNAIINGAVDWVYEEEFSMSQGYEWSPDGQFLAFYRFDESAVKEFSMDIYGTLYPVQERWKYPKAGEANSEVQVWVYSMETGNKVKVETGEETDIYLPRIRWGQEAGHLVVERLNRLQNHFELLFVDAKSGKSEVVYEEKPETYVDITDNWDYLKGKVLFTSERDGKYNRIYLFDYKKNKIEALTPAEWDVDNYYGYDEEAGLVYFSAANKTAIRRNVLSVNLKGKIKSLSDEDGWNSASFTKGFKYYLHTWSKAGTPTVYTLRNAKGEEVRMLQDNFMLKATLKDTELGSISFDQMETSGGVKLNYYMVKPADFDPSKKYPVLMYVYGGPGSQQVVDRWGGSYYMWFNYLASKGYIVACVDNRGTGFRGVKFKKSTYLQLGKYEIEDQISAAKHFGSLDYVDESRIGIFGWSYGGYMSSLGITKGADVFKAAVAVAPVTNWRYYDNIYTERFMRTPQENGENYDVNSPINFVDRIKGNYLIVHGTADDNVHFQNAVEMVDAMIKAGVRFDSEFYPNRAHGISGGNTRMHLFSRISTWLFDNL